MSSFLTCPHCKGPLRACDIEFNFAMGFVSCGGKMAKMVGNQLTVLEALIDAYPFGVSLDRLYGVMYADRHPDDTPTDNVVAVCVSQVRAKLDEAKMPFTIGSLRAGGHRTVWLLIPRDIANAVAA